MTRLPDAPAWKLRTGFWAAFLLMSSALGARCQEPASLDLLEELVRNYEAPLDQPAIEVSAKAGSAAGPIEAGVQVSSENGPARPLPMSSGGGTSAPGTPGAARQLAMLQADFSVLAEGLETFRDSGSTADTLKRISGRYVPELGRFLRERDSGLDALYRVLAVTDYTWAMRFPDADCKPSERRGALLASKDGLFADPVTGQWWPWVALVLELDDSGPAGFGLFQRALTDASLRPQDYEALRVRLRELMGALASAETSGADRTGLYCERAEVFERLGAAHRRKDETGSLVAAGPAEKAASSVMLVAVSSGSGYKALGAAVLVRKGHAIKFLADAGLLMDPQTGLLRTGLMAFAKPSKSGGPVQGPFPLKVERTDDLYRLAVGKAEGLEDLPGLKLAGSKVEQGDLLWAVTHGALTGSWTISQGLATATGRQLYRSDALLGPESGGSALINQEGELAGVAVRLDAGVLALQPKALKTVLEGGAVTELDAAELGSEGSRGSTAILTPARPFEEAGLVSESGGLVETGLGSSLGGVAWDGGGSLPSPGRFSGSGSSSWSSGSTSWSSGSSSYQYDPDSPAAQFGRRIGTAFRETIGRFLTWLFTPSPRVAAAPKPPKPAPPPPPPPPPPKPKIAGLSLTASPSRLTAWGQVTLTAQVSLDQAGKPLAGLPAAFEVPDGWSIRFLSRQDQTDSSGLAAATVDIPRPKGSWKDSDTLVFKARVSGAGEVQGSASASAGVQPPPMPLITGLNVTADSEVLAFKVPVSLVAALSFNEAAEEKAGILVRFIADPERYARFGQGAAAGAFEARTDAEGRAEVQVLLIEDERMKESRQKANVQDYSRDAFASMDAEADKVARVEDTSSEDEETQDAPELETAGAPVHGSVSPGMWTKPQVVAPSVRMTGGLDTTVHVRVTATVMPPPGLQLAPGLRPEQSVGLKAGAKRSEGNRVRMHAQFGRASGRGTHFGDRVKTNVDEATAQQMLTDLKNDILNRAKSQDLSALWLAVKKASAYLMAPKHAGGSQSFDFGKKLQNRIDIEISGRYPYASQ
ncbi:MAG: hypothetical protein HY924_06695 [Elusimicrobia bacterium]|nr:hypothetical protein [Elusimicrobiota bacterium]